MPDEPPLNASYRTSDGALLCELSRRFPTIALAAAQVASSHAALDLPAAVVHVISDVHGEYKKLRHVINNASGSLRPLVEQLFANCLQASEIQSLLATLYYPREQIQHLAPVLSDPAQRAQWVRATLRNSFDIIRELARRYQRGWVLDSFPPEHRELFQELLDEPCLRRDAHYVDEMLTALAGHDQDLPAVRAAARVVRNLACTELIVAGDLGDRGPRLDRVIDYLQQQPHVSIVWGNHDVEWMGACLGQEALIATVLRFSTRYNRLAQLEEGYGIPLEPLEKLAREVYGTDPCDQFKTTGDDLRDAMLIRRMQKAATIMQFKLEAQTSRRHSDWNLEHRNLLHRIDRSNWTIAIDGMNHALLDRNFPTVDWNNPYELSAEERFCMDNMRQAFVTSVRLWQQMRWLVNRGRMWTRRGAALIFHACVPVNAAGSPLPLLIDGKPLTGRKQMDAIDVVIRRAFRKGAENVGADADLFWYLWAGDRSPLFGKDKMATFEGYFVADEAARDEHKNPYFQLIHDADFCRKIGRDFDMGDDVLIVNGHVPVRIEKGESPIKRGGNAVTIDGAFSEAYGDRGYTMILDPSRIALAEHAHFESVENVIESGIDMVPKMTTVRQYNPPQTARTTEEGNRLRQEINALEELIRAYQSGEIEEMRTARPA